MIFLKKAFIVFILLLAFLLCSCDLLIPEISIPSFSIPETSVDASIDESVDDESVVSGDDGSKAEESVGSSTDESRSEESVGGSNDESKDEESVEPDFAGKLGSATDITDGTIIVSIFADDKTTDWNGDDGFKREMLRALGIGAKWITDSAKDFDSDAKFYYADGLQSDLVYSVKFDEDMVRYDGSMYSTQRQYVLDEIDNEGLLKKYGAKNIIYAFFFDTALDNEVNPWTIAYSKDNACDIELIDVFCRFDDLVTPPATLAHEILHCFGAHDLYYASDSIPQAFVDHCVQSGSNDIMYTVNMGDEITSVLTELAAYYVGLVDECELVNEWKLAKSEHIG